MEQCHLILNKKKGDESKMDKIRPEQKKNVKK